MDVIKILKIHPDAQLPRKNKDGDSGYDLYVLEDVAFDELLQYKLIRTGIALELPQGYEAQLRPRSSSIKNGYLVVLGTIDNGYRGEILIPVINFQHKLHSIKVLNAGDRIAQIVITKIEEFELIETPELNKTKRGADGFGSSGK